MSRFANKQPHKVVADVFNYKYVIAGRPKAGKTSLVHGLVNEKYEGDLSKLLLVAFEKGYNALDGIYAEDINEWEDFQELADDLVNEKDEIPFKILAFDTVDVMSKMATDYVIKTQSRKDGKRYTAINDLAYGKGYELLERTIGEEIQKLDKAGFTLIFITHDKDRQFETREGLKYDKTTLSLSGRTRDLILNMVDFIVFVELGKELVKGQTVDKRYIYFRGDSGLEAGSRFKNVPNRIEYGYREFIDTVEEAILSEYGGDTKAVEKAKKEQEAIKEAKANEYVDSIKNSKSADELIEEITELIQGMDKATKTVCATYFKDNLGNMDYRKSDDATALLGALDFVKSRA
ncbi:MAG: ATP-binding protein [Psychrobacillus sp.]